MKQTKMLTRFYAPVVMIALVLMGFSAPSVLAQDQDQEVEADGQEHREQFNDALEIAREGQSAMEGGDLEAAFSSFDEARQEFLEAAELAAENDDPEVEEMSYQRSAQMAYFAGRMANELERYDDALEQFEAGIEVNPDYTQNYLARAVAYSRLDQQDEAIEAYAEAMETGDQSVQSEAEDAIRSQFHHRASQLLSQESVSSADANQALEYLEEMQEYVEPNANSYYYMAAANEALGNMTEAVELATTALEMHTGSRSDRARIHLIRGEAQLAAGNADEACQDFEEANVGDFQQRAQHHLEHSCQ